MSADLMPFAYEGTLVRTVVINDEPWFVLADLCAVLDIAQPRNVAARLAEDQKGVRQMDTLGGRQQMTIVNESGMYEVVIRSDKPGAVTFRRWITAEVLPAIRKTGGYTTVAALPDRRALAQMVLEAEDRADAEHAARLEAEQHARALEAPASAWSTMAESSGDYSVADAAKVLSRDANISIGRDRLFSFMAAEGWIFRDRGTSGRGRPGRHRWTSAAWSRSSARLSCTSAPARCATPRRRSVSPRRAWLSCTSASAAVVSSHLWQ